MKQVAKLVIVDDKGKYLLLQRSNHPVFGNDPDLPGGTLEEGELPLQTMIREVFEEVAIKIDQAHVIEMYAGTDYSHRGAHYSLYRTELQYTPQITVSWEHSMYEWLDRDAFFDKVSKASDSYMRMVYDVLNKQ